ncbi:hypothetical protein Y013_20550 [Rhodococcus pyridinivorans SB3094]|uniref:Uncharacterized protein n=1 Tax=Rhodococcus pyridinivorans SB3094 TaxID=1435356 RepID=V9XKA3_9NOCA|nr:hypothetical protein Y013_20550 [Rhodococcus pyridinivorans SB3094]
MTTDRTAVVTTDRTAVVTTDPVREGAGPLGE